MTEAGEGVLVGAVFCGGRSRRFGTDKALAPVGGMAMGLRVAEALRDAGADPVVAVGGTAGPALGLPTIDDRHPGAGPLGGLATILRWATDGLVLVAPCDLPLLSADHLRPLVAAAGPDRAAVAEVDGRPQPSLACWPATWGRSVQRRFDGGDRAWRAALEVGSWVAVELPSEATADADTPEELAQLWAEEAP
ncbi:MAG: molybdenum cofactor guanylyltransferase [Actinomycetota bacterium]